MFMQQDVGGGGDSDFIPAVVGDWGFGVHISVQYIRCQPAHQALVECNPAV
jgi:hypothetical protein